MRTPGERGDGSAAGDDEWEIPVSPTLLFRFSALTYNAHRIHYDRDYAATWRDTPACYARPAAGARHGRGRSRR